MVDFEDDIKACLDVLRNGGVILYPTDTVWGLGCDATNEAAVDLVFRIKERPAEKSMIVLLAEARDVIQHVPAPHPNIISIVDHFDTPTTVIYENALGFAANITAADGSLGIRVPDDPFCRALIKRFRKPIVSTSANISGQPAPALFRDISPVIIDRVNYVVHYRRDDTIVRAPSRLVKISEDGNVEVMRRR